MDVVMQTESQLQNRRQSSCKMRCAPLILWLAKNACWRGCVLAISTAATSLAYINVEVLTALKGQ
eukprot:14498-Heterococcus_DN1.PRE.3